MGVANRTGYDMVHTHDSEGDQTRDGKGAGNTGYEGHGYHFDFAISRAALIRGASVRSGSHSLKNGC